MSDRSEFLVCVADAQETQVAVECGADRIEIVRTGAVMDLADIRKVVKAAAGKPVSVSPKVLGDGNSDIDVVRALADCGVHAVKLSGTAAADVLFAARSTHPSLHGTAAIGVDADGAPDLSSLGVLAEAGFRAALFSPLTRPAPRLIDAPGIDILSRCIEAAQRRGLHAGLGGGLEPPDIPRMLALRPDFLAFRTCLCVGEQRDAPLDPARVRMARELMPTASTRDRYVEIDDASAFPSRDKVFVRDYVVEAGIGAYRFEHRKPQRMRFNVEAELRPVPDTVADMRDVFSYDVIVDAIGLAIRKHAILVERVALDVAHATLADPRVRRVRVRVEKLDIIAGSVGVEIERER